MNEYTNRMSDIISATAHDTTLYAYRDTLASARQILINDLQEKFTPMWLKRRQYVEWWLNNTPSPYQYIRNDKGVVVDVVKGVAV